MIPIGALAQGMIVVTPTGQLARADGMVIDTRKPDRQWWNLTYHTPPDPEAPTVQLETHLLRAYRGPPVVFPAEVQRLQRLYADPVKPVPGATP